MMFCFWIELGLKAFISRNFNLEFCLHRRGMDFESKFSDGFAALLVDLEDILPESNLFLENCVFCLVLKEDNKFVM